ncbi:condensation domain-containing protein [Streptosporangium sp. NPDC023615]|uniref:condensation domain-containing protein n=1 Tax=Streptosporangium sp. NPDC023615 TaxID=3154794 RepID=UPI00341576E0
MKSANLCWGQRHMWLRFHQLPPRHRRETHVVLRFDLPAGLTVAACRAMLTYLVRRHEILRTTFDLSPEPAQRVHPPAPLPVTVATTERDGTPAPADVVEELGGRPFDLAGEWPIRACLITTGGVPRHCVLVFNHLAVDVWTLGEIKRELRTQGAGIAARRPAALLPVSRQPADLARYEASADAAIVASRAMAYWQEEVAGLPADPFATRRGAPHEPSAPLATPPSTGRDARHATPGTPPEPPARHATLISPAMLGASRRIAARHGVWPSLVHVAAYTAMMAAYTGQDDVAHLAFVSNRESHPCPDVLTCMFSPMLVRVGCAGDPSFGELLRRAAAAYERAGEHAYVPYDKVVEMVSREGSRRGTAVRLGSEVNFIKQRTREYGGRRTAFTWNPVPEAWAHNDSDTYLRVDEWCDAVALSLHAASPVMDAVAVERFLRGMEALVLAHDPGPALTTPAADPADPAAPAGPPLGEAARTAGFGPPRGAPVASPIETWDGVTGPAALALADAVRRAHRPGDLGADLDLSHSYTLAGGQALRIPQVLAELARGGWEGLTLNRLAGPTPLGALASRLVPDPRNVPVRNPAGPAPGPGNPLVHDPARPAPDPRNTPLQNPVNSE